MELEDALGSTLRTCRDLGRLVTLTHPEWVLYLVLLLRVAEDLAWVFRCDDVKELEFGADLQEIAMILLNVLFKDAVFSCTRSILVFDSIIVGVASGFLLRLLLVGTEEFVSHLIVDVMFTFVEAQSDKCLVELLRQLYISILVAMFGHGQSTSMLDVEKCVVHTFLT